MSRPPTEGLTERQREVLRWIRDFIGTTGLPPTVREIGRALKIESSTAFYLLTQLEKKGCLRRGDWGARSLEIVEDKARELLAGAGRALHKGLVLCKPRRGGQSMAPVPLVGAIAAGSPILAEENLSGSVMVDKGIASRGRCFALDVRGDSMADAGISDGDLVIVRQQPVAESGDVVVALMGDEATVKELSIQEDRIELRPCNSAFKPMQVGPEDGLQILGKVIAVAPGEGPHVDRRS